MNYYELQTLSAVLGIIAVVVIIMALAVYILSSIAIMKISKNRGMDKPWLAWIPIARLYLLGKISDDINGQYQSKTNRRIILMISGAVNIVLSAVVLIMSWRLINRLIEYAYNYSYNYSYNFNYYFNYDIRNDEILWSILVVLLVIALVLMVTVIIQSVFAYLSYYTIFKEYSPSNAILFIVLTILIGGDILASIFMLAIGKNTPQYTLLNTRSAYGQNQYAGYQPNQPYQPQQSYQQQPPYQPQQPYQQQPPQQPYQQQQPPQQPSDPSQQSQQNQNDSQYPSNQDYKQEDEKDK